MVIIFFIFKFYFSITVSTQYYFMLVSDVQHSAFTDTYFTQYSP